MEQIVRRIGIAAGVVLGVFALLVAPASAQTYTGVAPPVVVLSDTGQRPAPVAVLSNTGERLAPVAVLPFQVSSSAGSATPQAPITGLAFTGADIMGLVTIALVALALGAALTRRARPRTES